MLRSGRPRGVYTSHVTRVIRRRVTRSLKDAITVVEIQEIPLSGTIILIESLLSPRKYLFLSLSLSSVASHVFSFHTWLGRTREQVRSAGPIRY